LGGSELLLFSLIQSRTMIGVLEGGQLLLGLAISYLMVSRGLPSSRIASGPTPSGEDA
jgi:hypothetical protein